MKKLKKLGLYGLLWSSLFTYPVYCFGVGLGNIQVNTHLNQPLQAIIPLHTLNDVSPTEIKVRLADTNAFEKAGLERPFYLTEIDFKVVERDNQTFIEISSVEPIQDPFLSFVLEANWASGRILREYTVLLDPPSKESVNLAHKLQPKIVPIPRATEKPKKETGEIFGPVGPEHTLWNIATVVSSKTGGDIHQSVIALAKKNPQAFIGGNINKLRKGTTLQLPNKEEVFQLSISEAIVQVKELITETKSLAKQPQEPIKPLESSMESQQRQPVVEKPLKLMVPGSTTS
ncbi:MAG TPA: FimV/HubP family polar landmark protein, partial [Gammaproteobacteria bacterium]|nr:FimV/HubP family polar landmark protein [Gammaproteobacteria bacterium]